MRKIYSIFVLIFILSGCFYNSEKTVENKTSETNNIEEDITNNINLDNEIQNEEFKAQELEAINENKIDELINIIIE